MTVTRDEVDDVIQHCLKAVLEPGEQVLWTGRKKVLFGKFRRRMALFAAVFLTICWTILALASAVGWYLSSITVALPNLLMASGLVSWSWCFYFSIDRNSRLARWLTVFFSLVLTACWLLSALYSLRVLLWTPDADDIVIFAEVTNILAMLSLLLVAWWSILSDGFDGASRRRLFLSKCRIGFLAPFPVFHANDRVVATPLDDIADISVTADDKGRGDLTFLGQWSLQEPRFSGPFTIYGIDNVEDLARKLSKAAGIEPTICVANASKTTSEARSS